MDRADLPEPIRYLLTLPRFGQGIGLHRMLWLLDRLRARLPLDCSAIKVTGSNGKGSTCALLASILGALGADPGLYTSPHLIHFNERIVLAGKPISTTELEEAVDWYRQASAAFHADQPDDRIGAFEAFTAIALYHYARQGARHLVLEAGIGGRYDSTRVVPGSLTALTSLDLEHQELLGDTLEQIAYDKLDLCPEGGTVVAGPLDAETLRRVRGYCRVRNVDLVEVEEATGSAGARYRDLRFFADLTVEGRLWPEVEIGLRGPHQLANARIAILLARRWAAQHRPGLALSELETAIRRGLSSARWPGRFEQIHEQPDIFIDVGHSPAAAEALVETVRGCLAGRRLLLVLGVSYNKAVEAIVTRLVPLADEVICTRAYHKGAPAAVIAELVGRLCPRVPLSCADTIEAAAGQAWSVPDRRG